MPSTRLVPYASSSPPRRWFLRSQRFRLGRCSTAGTNDKHSVLPALPVCHVHELGEKRELKLGGDLNARADARYRMIKAPLNAEPARPEVRHVHASKLRHFGVRDAGRRASVAIV